jgi:hypothetical protein
MNNKYEPVTTQVHNWSGIKERTFRLLGKLEQSFIPCLKYTPPGYRCLCTQPRSSKLGLTAPPIRSSPHGVESIFEREVLLASLHDEFTHHIESFGIPWFEPFRVVEHEEWIFD